MFINTERKSKNTETFYYVYGIFFLTDTFT